METVIFEATLSTVENLSTESLREMKKCIDAEYEKRKKERIIEIEKEFTTLAKEYSILTNAGTLVSQYANNIVVVNGGGHVSKGRE